MSDHQSGLNTPLRAQISRIRLVLEGGRVKLWGRWIFALAVLFFVPWLHAQPSGGGGGTPKACVGTPGNTTGSYRQLCLTSAGALYACNNASGCKVAGDWVAQGGGGGAPTGPAGGGLSGTYPNPNTRCLPVTTLPAASAAVVGQCYDWSQAVTANTCPSTGGTGGSGFSKCFTLDGSVYQVILTGVGASGNVTLPGTVTAGNSKVSITPTNGIEVSSYQGNVLLSGLSGPICYTAGVPRLCLVADLIPLWSGIPTSNTLAAGDGTWKTVSPAVNPAPGSPILWNPYTATPGGFFPGGGLQACAQPLFWPDSGYVRHMGAATSNTQDTGLSTRVNVAPDCFSSSGTNVWPGGAIIPPGSSAGGFLDSFSIPYAHAEKGGQLAAYFTKQSAAGTSASLTMMSAEFVSDAGDSRTILQGSSNAPAPASSTTTYYAVNSGKSDTTELNLAMPVPVAGRVIGIVFCWQTSAPANTASFTLNLNGVAQDLTVSVLSTDSASGCKTDFVHTAVSIAAGQYIDFAYATGASTVAKPGYWAAVFVPANGTSSIWSATVDSSVSSTTYEAPGQNGPNGTQQLETAVMNYPCQATNLYMVLPSAPSGSNTITAAVQQNLSSTAVTGTITSSGSSGATLLYSGAPVSLAAGDQIGFKFTPTVGPTTVGSVSFSCN